MTNDLFTLYRKLRKLRRNPSLFLRDALEKRGFTVSSAADAASPPAAPASPPAAPASPPAATTAIGPELDPDAPMRWPAGHYYSPIPRLSEVHERQAEIWPRPPPPALHGIDLALDRQLRWVDACRDLRAEFPYPTEQDAQYDEGLRFRPKNGMFGIGDALALYTVMRTKQPRRIVEVGSGFSSAVMLDTNERYLDNSVSLTFIDPYPERLRSILRSNDHENAKIIDRPLQEVVMPIAKELEANDILFIDSSHVSKTGSDVNYLLFEVLPVLAPGVMVHVHDMPYPFEYPRRWVDEGRAWNEVYVLRAFLMNNDRFQVEWFISSLKDLRSKDVRGVPGGSYLWLQRVGGSATSA